MSHSPTELQQELQLTLTQLLLQQQHLRLIQEVLAKSRDKPDIVQTLYRSLRCLQSSQLLNQQAFEVGVDYVYVLELEGGNFYIGTSANLPSRLHQHFVGDGSLWTKAHKPVKVVEICLGDKPIEKEKTLEYMKLMGFEKVRGYCWCSIHLENPPKDLGLVIKTLS